MAARRFSVPRLGAGPHVIDALLGSLFATGAIGVARLASASAPETAAVLGATLPLVARRRVPLLVVVLMVAARSVQWLVAPKSESVFELLALLVALYTVAARQSAAAVAGASALVVGGLLFQVSRFPEPDWAGDTVPMLITYRDRDLRRGRAASPRG